MSILSAIYAYLIKFRNALYDSSILRSYSAGLPVISVGNISAGGNGKTPLVMWIVDMLREQGRRPIVLMRGYGGSDKGPTLVKDNLPAAQVGDEACMYAKLGYRVVVSRERVAGAALIRENNLADIVVLDDGFQHRKLKRNLDIVSISIANEKEIADFCRAELLPCGRLREPLESALQRADAIVFALRRDKPRDFVTDQRLLSLVPKSKPVFLSYLRVSSIQNSLDASPLLTNQVCVLCAIANPDGFISTLESNGLNVINKFTFKDHHFFTASEIEKILLASDNLPLVCTQKDIVKLTQFSLKNLFVVSTQQVIEPEAEFKQIILEAASTARR